MPGDSVFHKYIEGLGNPWLLFVIGILAILAYIAVKTIPMVKEIRLKKIECDSEIQRMTLEQASAREKRKADEFQQELQRDKERTEVIGKQNEILEHLAHSHDNDAVQMSALIASLEESKLRSREMGELTRDTNEKVSEIHTIIVKSK